MTEQTKTILLIWLCTISICTIAIFSCQKNKPEQTTKTQYQNTIAEVFRILDTCGIRNLEMLDILDLSDYEEIQWRSLDDSLSTQGNYYCISRKVDQGQKIYYIENTLLFLNFLSTYGSIGANVWDTNNDQEINTTDLIHLLTAYDQTLEIQPDLTTFDIFENYGEGNTWLDYTGQDSTILFGWIHRTPYDEINGGNYVGFDLYSFTLDIARVDSVEFFDYIRP